MSKLAKKLIEPYKWGTKKEGVGIGIKNYKLKERCNTIKIFFH